MIYVCSECQRELEVEINQLYHGTNDPVTVVTACTCLRDEKVAWIAEDLATARQAIIEQLDELRRSL